MNSSTRATGLAGLLAGLLLHFGAASADTVDGAPNFDTSSDSGLYVWRTLSGDWHVRLLAGSGEANFVGHFESGAPIENLRLIALQARDSVELSSVLLGLSFSTSSGHVDGVRFSTSGGRLCLYGARGVTSVHLGRNAVRHSLPADLTGNGACEPEIDTGEEASVDGRKYHPGHYVSMRPGDSDSAKLNTLSQNGVAGLQIRYQWADLETGFDLYEFSEIQADLDLAASHGKQLVVFVEDKSFNWRIPTPRYLHAEYTLENRAGGYSAIRWHPWVAERFAKLLRMIGENFDSHPAFEGVAIQETSLGLDDWQLTQHAYTPEAYRDALIAVLVEAAGSMPSSRVFWYMNFFPQRMDYIAEIAQAVASAGVAMGGPDVLPDDPALQRLVYPFYDQFEGRMPLFNSMQYDSYKHVHADPGWPGKYWTPEELTIYARDELHVEYLFWNRKTWRRPSDSYVWVDALPAMSTYPLGD